MQTLLIALTPILVSFLTSQVKKIKIFKNEGYRNISIRFVAALFSYGAVVLNTGLIGGDVDVNSTQTFAEALMVFLGSTGTFFLFKKK